MTEPITTTTAASIAAAASGLTLALLGVDYYSLLGGALGAMLTMGRSDQTMGRIKAMGSVALTALIGAVLASAMVELLDQTNRKVLIAVALVCGAGAQKIVAKGIAAMEAAIAKIGGEKS